MKQLKTLDVRTRQAWRRWLERHHEAETEIWLVFHKRHTGRTSVEYNDAVDEALCFGWIDSLVRRLDEDRYARKFTPRKPNSKWSTINRRRYAALKAESMLAPAGLKRGPTAGSGYPPRPTATMALPSYIERVLRSNRSAWKYFEGLAPSHRRMYIGWIDSAKRPEMKEKRLREAVGLLAAGRKPGLK
jgi:uncharacterized protein YdeI (YjbR/CyaY-like superfamily)